MIQGDDSISVTEQPLAFVFNGGKNLAMKAWSLNPCLSLLVLFSLLSLLCSALGLTFDHRLINGELAWIKPFKFSVSLALYGSSLIFISSFFSSAPRLLKFTSLAALVGAVAEISAIIVQVFRGAPSHFNFATPLDSALWYVIKLAIMPVALAILAMLVMLMRQKELPQVLGNAIRWGALLTVVGFIPGFLMLMPESLQHVFTNHVMIGHTVGPSSSAQTMPLIGWNAVAGDLRIAHFVGLHALQVLPLIGFAISRLCRGLSQVRQGALVSISGCTYLALIFLLTWQALRGESIAAPGHSTIASYITLFAACAGSVSLALVPFNQFGLLRLIMIRRSA
jgi:hypothetical protein